jgi:hypothetical protein
MELSKDWEKEPTRTLAAPQRSDPIQNVTILVHRTFWKGNQRVDK